jgi:hypothetical protein
MWKTGLKNGEEKFSVTLGAWEVAPYILRKKKDTKKSGGLILLLLLSL